MLAAGELANNFDRFMMVGHYHLWYAATAGRPLEWKGDKKLFISNKESVFLVIAPVFSEFCAVLEIQKDSDGEKTTLGPYEFIIVPERTMESDASNLRNLCRGRSSRGDSIDVTRTRSSDG